MKNSNNGQLSKEVINNIKEIAGMKQHLEDTCNRHIEFEKVHKEEHKELNDTIEKINENLERLNKFEFKIVFISALFGTISGIIASYWKQIKGLF